MNTLLLRMGALLLHAFLNFIFISWLFKFDITGSWIAFGGFFLLLFVLLIVFIKHLVSFINYIKSVTK